MVSRDDGFQEAQLRTAAAAIATELAVNGLVVDRVDVKSHFRMTTLELWFVTADVYLTTASQSMIINLESVSGLAFVNSSRISAVGTVDAYGATAESRAIRALAANAVQPLIDEYRGP